ncbi:hypothetical protein ACOMHN_033805 [Nucella lapillus]
MSEHQNGTCSAPQASAIQRILQKLGCSTSADHADDGDEKEMLCTLSAEARDYMQQMSSHRWPPTPHKSTLKDSTDSSPLKKYLAWALNRGDFPKAVGAMLLLDSSHAGPMDSSLFDDVMQYIDDKGAGDIIPPQLLLIWAKRLQIKGDLHGAIRRLNAAQTMLKEHKESFPCQCEAERIRGECLQLSGLTLNKMCCWKSAIQPLMESAGIFRNCAASEKTTEAIVIAVEMVAKCLCSITHGDYMELKDQLSCQYSDRFYQAYTMCKDIADLASSSQLLFIKVQNQAAEALLKYAATQEDVTARDSYLQTVILEIQKSLQAHTSKADLERRGQFFELIRSVFLLYLTLDFSDNSRDRIFAGKLEDQARSLYAEYCKQLAENEFICDKIDIEKCPDITYWISSLSEDFGLELNLQNGTTPKAEISTELKEGDGKLIRKTNDQTKACEEKSSEKFQKTREEADTRARNKVQITQPHHRREVGLPINPEDYAIPLYDVPLTIFRDLCGCKFTGGDQNRETDIQLLSKGTGTGIQYYTSQETDESARSENGSMFGITDDSGYGSSVVLVDTILTTKLPDTEASRGSDLDSAIGSSCSSAEDSSIPAIAAIKKTSMLQCSAGTESVKKARLLKFNPVTGLWSSQTSLVYVGQALQLADSLKGNCRDALHVQFLHQDEVMGRYVGKRYRRQRPPSQYLQDVTCQKTARFLVTLFNYALQDLRYDIQVVYVPVAHLQLLSSGEGEEEAVEDWLNVEPYLDGDFVKLTNNLNFCNSQGRTLSTALTHFTHTVSEGKLMLVDLQGWLPREGRGVVYLTDPQFHTTSTGTSTSTPTPLSSCDMGARGMQAFWERVHPDCNAICQALGLKRPQESPSVQGLKS